jgi:hypothetical protein
MAGKHGTMGLKSLSLTHPAHLKLPAHRAGQLGFIGPRPAAILAVLVLILVVPLWWSKNKKDSAKTKTVVSASQISQPQPTSQAATVNAPAAAPSTAATNPDRFGLSFGQLGAPDAAPGLMSSACNGTPLDMANPDKGQCNPTQGDSVCRSALPVLCVLQDGSTAESAGLAGLAGLVNGPKAEGSSADNNANTNPSAGWVSGTLGATAPVAGFVLGSLEAANARCAKELGAGWRMAELHDGKDGSASVGLLGKRGPGLSSQQTRHWVYANGQKSHCWDAS